MGIVKHLSEHPSLLPEILIFKFESVHRTEALAIVLDNLAGATQQKMIVFNCVKNTISFSVKHSKMCQGRLQPTGWPAQHQ